ncbi:MAG: RNA polymerase sigma factor RpoD/SigA [Parcubacteria group bacterium]|nr:RNA polymerase sigma factor RpoD/SigA [Parcubacteria group bacterium]
MNERDLTLQRYFDEIADSQPLSSERESELAIRIRAGDERARNELAEANVRFVVRVAKMYLNRGLSLAELVSAGNLGLMMAAERFDETRGFKFITYAVWWIRQAILQAIAEGIRTVRVPGSRRELIGKVVRHKRKIEQDTGEEADNEEIAAEVGLPVDEVAEVLADAMGVRSLDALTGVDGEPLLTRIPDERSPMPDERASRASDVRALDALVRTLGGREEAIVRAYYGLGDAAPMTLESIGGALGVTRERVRQLKVRALRALRNGAHSERAL